MAGLEPPTSAAMHDLVEDVFLGAFANPLLAPLEDQARVALSELTRSGDRLAFTTDSFVVDPLFFPGCYIGWLEGRNILALNLVSSPGAGKTTLLERTLKALGDSISISVVEGDQETAFDAERIRATGCRVIQVNTGTGCHLEAGMLADALRGLDPPPDSMVLIENVGNLVCPALFDLSEDAKVAILSVTEGTDKPLKYPHMFRAARLMVVNKIDLLPFVDFDTARCADYARRVNPDIEMLAVSATTGAGLADWYAWLRDRRTTWPAAVS